MTALVMSSMALGVVLLSVSLLVVRKKQHQSDWWLMALLLTCTIFVLAPLSQMFFPVLKSLTIALSLPALLALMPLLWLYVLSITAGNEQLRQAASVRHFALSLFGLTCAVLVLLLPEDVTSALSVDQSGSLNAYVSTLMIVVFLLVISWPLQSLFYIVRLVRYLKVYHLSLKQEFANNENRELHWITWLVILLLGVWLVIAISLLADNLYNIQLLGRSGVSAIVCAVVWLLSLFGLRQQPGWVTQFSQSASTDNTQQSAQSKYQRSALGEEQAARIAEKIELAMREDSLYLDSNISLSKLSAHIGASPNYVSQTLNDSLGQTFFDYINGWRVDEAKARLIDSNDSVLEIAMAVGFNARSSFYNAFRQITDMTPSAYRRQHR